jgi:CheY-like chemotaxis protein
MARRVLIIDDEDDIREVAQLSLEAVGGWEVLTASSGAEGLRTAQQSRPDAILLDVMMPDMDGPSTFQRMQGMPDLKSIPVILLTAKVQLADRKRFEDLGVAGVISKPFDPMTLSELVSETLGWAPG